VIVAVASRKASPGVTTVTAQLAAHWFEPGVDRLIVEADCSGGTLAARWSPAHGLTWDPGLLSLSTSRRQLDAASLGDVSQQLADQVWVAAAPPAPDQIGAGLFRLGEQGASELASAPGIRAFVDCGRLTASSPAVPLARRALLTLLVCRPRLDEIHALVPAATELAAAGCTVGLVCIGTEPYEPGEVAATVGVDLIGVLPTDERAAAAFDRDGLRAGRVYRRSHLASAVEELADRVHARLSSSSAITDGDEVDGDEVEGDEVEGEVDGDEVEGDEVDGGAGERDAEYPVSMAVLAARAWRDGRRGAALPNGGDR
jgi:hypothetical protein